MKNNIGIWIEKKDYLLKIGQGIANNRYQPQSYDLRLIDFPHENANSILDAYENYPSWSAIKNKAETA